MRRFLDTLLVGTRSLLFIPLSILLLAATATVMLFLRVDERKINGPLAHRWARLVLWLADVRVTVEGTGRIPSLDDPYIVVMNHQSNMDIPVILYALPLQLRFIGKVELMKVPLFGSALVRAGHFLIDRKNHLKAMNGLHAAGKDLRQRGVSLVLAPEGTRSETGGLKPFKKGAFVMAIETGIPILPVTISGTRRSLPKGSLWARSAAVKMTIHDPVPTEELSYDDRDDLSERVRGIMEKTLEEGRGG
ncbi:MAG: lysophospholipid acyltransferase family protein [bacterium]|nr:lysophospholipid acyltransferase family protein [bacterium]MDT8396882.1 lysophospholipid acyltransferase family protein [bacterium]